MALPKMLRGFRRITLHSDVYRWRLSHHAEGSKITVLRDPDGGSRLMVSLSSFKDPWIHIPTAVINDPRHVTPAFVEGAVRAALAHEWSPGMQGHDFRLNYKSGTFSPEVIQNVVEQNE